MPSTVSTVEDMILHIYRSFDGIKMLDVVIGMLFLLTGFY